MESELFLNMDPSGDVELFNAHLSTQVTPFQYCDFILQVCQQETVSSDLSELVNLKKSDTFLVCVIDQIASDSFSLRFLPNSFNFTRFFKLCRTLCLSDQQAFSTIGSLFFCKPWSLNNLFQVKFIEFCIENNHVSIILNCCDTGSFNLCKTVSHLETLKHVPDLSNPKISTWKYQSLYQILLNLSNFPSITHLVENIFLSPLELCPELLILGFIDCPIFNEVKENILVNATLKFIYPTSSLNQNSIQILQKLWPVDTSHSQSLTWNQKIVLNAMIKLYNNSSPDEQQHKLSKILDLSQDFKALNYLLSFNSDIFSIDLACLASRRDYLKLDKWYKDKIDKVGDAFIDTTISFIKRRCSTFLNDTDTSNFRSSLPKETLKVILTCLQGYCSTKNVDINRPDLMNIIIDYQTSSMQNEQKSSSKIDSKIDIYFKRLFNPEMPDSLTTDQFLKMLVQFNLSTNPSDNETLNCIINVLVKELSYISNYPENEIVIMGQLLGGAIDHELMSGIYLVTVFKSLQDCFQSNSNSKLLKFAITALQKFKTNLKKYACFCVTVYNSPNFRNLPRDLCDYIEYGRSFMDPPLKKLENVPQVEIGKEVDTVAFDELIESFNKKLHFMFNNLDASKLELYSRQLCEILKYDQHYQIVSTHFLKRAFQEVNHHILFLDFIECIKSSKLSEIIQNETYTVVKELLKSKFTDINTKKLLSIGGWLGTITLYRNRPILSIHLDIRKLLIEAFHRTPSQLMCVVKFVTKILNSVKCSKVFAPPNPWTISILNILAELYSEGGSCLKLQLEIEILCSHLSIDIKSYIGKSNLIKVKNYVKEQDYQLAVEQSNLVSNVPSSLQKNVSKTDNSQLINSDFKSLTKKSIQLEQKNLSNLLKIQPKLHIISMYPSLDVCIKNIIEKYVYEWTDTYYCNIANFICNSVGSIVRKDFSLDPTVEKMMRAAQTMSEYFFSNMVQIQSKEPLSKMLQEKITSLLNAQCANIGKDMIESSTMTIVNDNITTCINYVREICIERISEEINNLMKPEVELRRRAQEGSSTYFDMNVYKFQNEKMPEQLRLNCGEIPSSKFNVYEEMSHHVASLKNSFSTANNHRLPKDIILPDNVNITLERFIKELSSIISDINSVNIRHPISNTVFQNLTQLSSNPRDQELILNLVKSVMVALRDLLMIKNNYSEHLTLIKYCRDYYILLLRTLVDSHSCNNSLESFISKFLVDLWFRIDIKFPDELFDILYQMQLVSYQSLDTEFCQILENVQNASIVKLIVSFLKCYIHNGVSANNFAQTLDFFRKSCSDNVCNNSPELKNISEFVNLNSNSEIKQLNNSGTLSEKVEILFKQWILCLNNEQAIALFFKNLSDQGILNSFDSIINFLKICLDLSISHCMELFNSSIQSLYIIHNNCFTYLDSFAYMLLYVMKIKNDVQFKMFLLNKVLTCLYLYATKDQKNRQENFIPLPYYRILVVLFLELCYNQTNYNFKDFDDKFLTFFNENVKVNLLNNFCNVMHLMAPQNFPSFTFAWLEFISHRSFIGHCLNDTNAQIMEKLWKQYFILLRDFLTFVKPLIENIQISKTFKYLYKGTFRLFVVLLHDFPDFLCEYCYLLIELIPSSAIQLQNIILSAAPSSLHFPNPLVPNLTLDSINCISACYKGLVNLKAFQKLPFKKSLDFFLTNQTSILLLNDLKQFFQSNNFNKQECLAIINMIIFYLGQYSITNYSHYNLKSIGNEPALIIIKYLLANFDSQLRYHLIKMITEHLRYPNPETIFFICVLMHLFKESDATIKEQIYRVLLERLLVYHPHPWGLIYVINEFSSNSMFDLWNYDFINIDPGIKKILDKLGIHTDK